MTGGSYFGATQWLAASAGPPALKAIAPFVTTDQYYESWAYQVVEPAQLDAGDVRGIGAAHQPEAALREPAGQWPVRPRPDDQPLQAARRVAAP
jgi:hypothetical protein